MQNIKQLDISIESDKIESDKYRKGSFSMTLNKSTLSEQIYQILRTDILNRKISMGEKLTLKNLQDRFEVSSTPIREALTRLTEDGLVNYYSNVGVNVISLNREDLIELYQFMGDLDRLAILYSKSHPQRDKICRELEEIVSKTGIIEEKDFPVDCIFRSVSSAVLSVLRQQPPDSCCRKAAQPADDFFQSL